MDCLPAELLHIIAGHLDQTDIFYLILSSRRFYNILQENIYAKVILYGGSSSGESAKQVRSFYSAIFSTPALASCVHSLALGDWTDANEGQAEVHGKPLSEIAEQFVSERNEYSEAEKSSWLEALQRGEDSDPWIALLLPQMRELRKLSINWPDVSHHVMNLLRKLSMAPEPIFPYLQEVCSGAYDGVESVTQSYYLDAFFRMQSVRKLGCYAVEENFAHPTKEVDIDEAEHNDPWGLISEKQDTLAFRCSNISDLDFAEVNAGNGMQEWIMACKALKSFRVNHSNCVNPQNAFQSRKIYEALSAHKLTLESLWAEPDSGCKLDIDSEWMGNFRDFIVLKTICLPFPNLVGFNEQNMPILQLVDVLPCSLKILYLMLDHGSSFMEAIMQVEELAYCEDFPELTALHLECYNISSTYEMTKLEWLQQRCEATGKSFAVHFPKGWFYGHKKPTGWIFGPDNEAEELGYLFR